MQRLRAFPDRPSHVQTVTLAGARYIYRRTYRSRLRGWYVDIYTADGTPVILGRRMVGEWPLFGGLPVEELAGILLVRGPDEYRREDLGDELREVFATFDELGDVGADEDDGFIVSIEVEE